MHSYEQLERAAIYQYMAGLSQEDAERLAGLHEVPADKEITLTKPEYDLLERIRDTSGVMLLAQNKQDKLAIHRLIKKGILGCDAKGWVYEVDHE